MVYYRFISLCSGKSREAYAVDKSPKALQQAKKNISRFSINNHCRAIQSDGFVNLHYTKKATVCLAGMGGQTMVSILQRGLDTKYQSCHPIHEIIVQPNKSALLCYEKNVSVEMVPYVRNSNKRTRSILCNNEMVQTTS